MDSKSKMLADEISFAFCYVLEKARVEAKREHNLISFASGIRRWRFNLQWRDADIFCRRVIFLCKVYKYNVRQHRKKNLVDVPKQS
jgi:hypothetical protein